MDEIMFLYFDTEDCLERAYSPTDSDVNQFAPGASREEAVSYARHIGWVEGTSRTTDHGLTEVAFTRADVD